MAPHSVGEVGFFNCQPCQNFWFGAGELEALLQVKNVKKYLPNLAGLRDKTKENNQGALECPVCEGGLKMIPMTSHMVREVAMQGCPVCHGRWIEGGALKILLSKARAGGLKALLLKLLP
ncbi:MAG: zf-TFIIB domain-containing protein [bacterium]